MSNQVVGFVGEPGITGSFNPISSDPTTWDLSIVTVIFKQKYTPMDVSPPPDSTDGVIRPQLPDGASYMPGVSVWTPGTSARMFRSEAKLLAAIRAVI